MLKRKPSSSLLVAFLCANVVAGFATRRPVATTRPSRPTGRRDPTSLAAKGGVGGAKKKKKKPKRAAQTPKGFGAPPPSLDEVLAGFETRVPEDAGDAPCPCGTGEVYDDCCGPLHRGDRPCASMTDVLRSRYAAFSWRIVGHVMSTTHPSCRDHRDDRVAWARDLDRGGMFDSFDFVKLEPGEEEISEENENEGFLAFEVTLRAKEDGNASLAGQETVISERSKFVRDTTHGTWSYVSGDVKSQVAGLEDTTLNA